jgi:hypothetical protein
MTAGFQESLVHSPVESPRGYVYRSRAGIIPSAEYAVYFDDFFVNPSSNALPGTTAVIDTGATITQAAADAISYTGVLKFASDGTTEGATLYWPKTIQLGLGKKFFMEVRCYTADADDTDVQFGLSDVTASSNPEDLWTTTAANLITFGVLDGDATVKMLCDKDNAGTSASTGDVDLSDATWHVLGIEVGGSAADSDMWVKGYVDGALAETWGTETSIPDDLTLSPFIGARTGGSAGHVIYFDYVRWSLQR